MGFGNDLRYALRLLARERGFAIAAVLTLALGIGANTAIFTVVNGVLLKPLAYRDPDRIYILREIVPPVAHLYPTVPANAGHFLGWREQCKSFEQLAAVRSISRVLTGAGEPQRLIGARVSANLMTLLGTEPQAGRSFLEEEDRPGHDRVVILTDALWRRRFGGEPFRPGRTIMLDGAPNIVAGVLPRWFRFPKGSQLGPFFRTEGEIEFFTPMAFSEDERSSPGEFDYAVLGRLKHGVTPERALAELNLVQGNLSKVYPEKMDFRAAMWPLRDQVVGQVRRGLLVLMAAVGAVLLIVCVNLANLLLARGAVRAHESAIRTALGATRARLVRQFLTESLLLAAAGGAIGIALAYWGVQVLVKSAPVDLPRLTEIRLDAGVLWFATGVSALTGLLFGILPALRVSRTRPNEELKLATRSTTEGARRLRLRDLLVSVEVGVSTVLLIVAGLLLGSFVRLMSVNKGFQVENVITAKVALPAAAYGDGARRVQFFDRVLPRLEALPGVRSAALVSTPPLEGEDWVDVVSDPGDRRPMLERPLANYRFITADFFRTMGIAILCGRTFSGADRGRPVALVSRRVASRLWPGQDAIGKRFLRGDSSEPPYEVIGVTADIRSTSLSQDPGMMVYVPYWKRTRLTGTLVVRTAVDPASIASAIRAAIWSVDSQVPVTRVETMRQLMAESVAQRRFQMLLIGGFAAAALVLASLGVFGVVSYSVARRRNELGIRMALGARPADLHRMVLRQGMMPVLAGLAAGVAAALSLGRVLSGLLFGVSAADPLTLASVVAFLALIGAAACYIPAVRATRGEPLVGLRYE